MGKPPPALRHSVPPPRTLTRPACPRPPGRGVHFRLRLHTARIPRLAQLQRSRSPSRSVTTDLDGDPPPAGTHHHRKLIVHWRALPGSLFWRSRSALGPLRGCLRARGRLPDLGRAPGRAWASLASVGHLGPLCGPSSSGRCPDNPEPRLLSKGPPATWLRWLGGGLSRFLVAQQPNYPAEIVQVLLQQLDLSIPACQ